MKRVAVALSIVVLGAAALLAGSLLGHPTEPRAIDSGPSLSQAQSAATPAASAASSPITTRSQRPCAQERIIGTLAWKRVTARARPSLRAKAIASFTRINPEGSPQVFDVGAQRPGPQG